VTRITRTTAFLALAISVALLLGCSTGSSDESSQSVPPAPQVTAAAATTAVTPTAVARTSYPLSVPTSDGRSVTLARAPERIVSLSPGNTEILFAIDAGSAVVGVDRFSDFPEQVKALPRIDYSNPNVEALAALRPDLVLASGRQRMLVPTFEQAGFKVVPLEEPSTVAGVLERIRLMGRMVDRIGPAEELAGRMQERVTAVTERVKGVSGGPRVYHEIDPKLFSAAPSSFVGDIYTLLKAQNIAAGASSPFPQLTAEAIIQADPEVIVLGDGLFPGGTPEEVKRRPGWSVISAVRTNRVYPVDDNTVSRPSPRVVEGLEQIAKLLYPDLFR
jgi:iron complex transport system substrate-binding protein